MERDQSKHQSQESIDWFKTFSSDTMNFSLTSRLKPSEDSENVFHDAHERFVASSATSSDLFAHFVKENEDEFSELLRSSSNASVDPKDETESREFIRSFSAGSDWICQLTKSSLTQPANVKSMFVPPNFNNKTNVFPHFCTFGAFPRNIPVMSLSVSGGRCFESWSRSNKIQMSRSTLDYPMSTNTYRYRSEQAMHCYQELFDVSESESDEDDVPAPHLAHAILDKRPLSVACSESTDTSSIIEPEDSNLLSIETSPDHRKERAYRLATELLTTERSYVQVLHLIDQIFHFRVDQENRAHPMFPQEMIPQMFSNIKSIYKFHHDFLLPQLEDRMLHWEQEQRIGDIMKNFAPFLKMYTEYVKNFDNAMNIISALGVKNQKFAAIMEDIQQMSECGSLTLPHHMLSPIQRVPRYELLLKDYLKKLPDDSLDREDTEKALHLVSTAANHANEAMKKIDNFKQLLDIQESISGVVDLVSPTRELIKEGKIVKISARSGDHQERYLFLFNDIMFLCSLRLISNRVIMGPIYRLRAKFNVEEIQVLEGDNLETANTFYIRDSHKNVELYTQTLEEKSAWLDTILLAIRELYERKSSLKIGADSLTPIETDIGKRAPKFLKMESVTKCMDCTSNFSVMKRKHHCRACGIILCSKCSNQKISLPCEDNKSSRVCRHCHQILSQRSAGSSPDKSPDATEVSKENIKMLYSRERGVLEVSADAACVFNSYLHLKTNKSWVRRWFSLHDDFVLYSFRSNTDQRALTATPLPGFTVLKEHGDLSFLMEELLQVPPLGTKGLYARVSELKGESFSEKEKVFKMFHAKKMYYFQASSKEEADKWTHVLQMAAKAELPSPEQAHR